MAQGSTCSTEGPLSQREHAVASAGQPRPQEATSYVVSVNIYQHSVWSTYIIVQFSMSDALHT